MKPYDFVRIYCELDGIKLGHIGQCISKITPNDTIMVRHIPDDPSTMEELRIASLSTISNTDKPKWIQYAIVSGWGSFPVDMLRYDCAWSIGFDASCELYHEKNEQLTIARATTKKNQPWTIARWNSFGWTVDHIKTLKIEGK